MARTPRLAFTREKRHGHKGDHLVYVLEGRTRDRRSPLSGRTLVVLEVGAVFGPLVAGAQGAWRCFASAASNGSRRRGSCARRAHRAVAIPSRPSMDS
jgi:hypothetical protein